MYSDQLEGDTYKVMCLANKYTTGRHNIHIHSDDEEQFCSLRDVVCWVNYIGVGRRRLIFREKHTSTIALSIVTGDCVYVMSGEHFQSTFRHEIPEEYPTLFKNRLMSLVPEEIPQSDGLACADWIAENKEYVRARLDKKDAVQFNEWVTARCSYTIRFFESST